MGIKTLLNICLRLYVAAAQRQRHSLQSGLCGATNHFSTFIAAIDLRGEVCNLFFALFIVVIVETKSLFYFYIRRDASLNSTDSGAVCR